MDVLLDARDVSRDDAAAVIFDGARVVLDETMLAALDRSAERFAALAHGQPIYGINTGFGPLVRASIDAGDWPALQTNLIRSHALGSGAPLPEACVRGVIFARLVSLTRGYSAIDRRSPEILARLLAADCLPVIPEHGGVGASGDLVQLAHVGLCLIGEGDVLMRGRRQPAAAALTALGVVPLRPRLREGLALVNGTAAMVGIGLETVVRARRTFDWCIALSCLLHEIVGSTRDAFSAELNAVKRHRGQAAVAERMREWLAGSGAVHDTAAHGRPLQEQYSIRCVPQIAGPILETLDDVQAVLVAELNSVSDNPVFDPRTGAVYHGGNFHGEYVAVAMDRLKVALTKLSMLCERQLNFLLNDRMNGLLPPFLGTGIPGLHMGLQGIAFTATSTTAENQTLAFPMSVHSISCNNDNQDIVSMGANAALLARKTALNTAEVATVLAMAVARAVRLLRREPTLAPRTQVVFARLDAREPSAADAALTAWRDDIRTMMGATDVDAPAVAERCTAAAPR